MERNRRLVAATLSLLCIWILLHSRLLLASAGGPCTGGSQDLLAGRLSSVRTGRFLLQDAKAPVESVSSHGKKVPTVSIVVGSVAAAVAFLLLVLITIGYFQHRLGSKVVDSHRGLSHEESKILAPSVSLSLRSFMRASGTPEKLSYKELESGTSNFTDKLGSGGRAFKGILSNLTNVAVKRFFVDFPRAEFEQDVKRVAALQHTSLVHLFGYCSDGDYRLLVYEYLSRGSLGNYLYPSSVSQPAIDVLDWSTRFRIMLGTARVIAFVHEHGSRDEALKVHGRIHPENILLTENYDPKLADYGFSRPHSTRDKALLRSTSVATGAGKYEYIAPEWWAADPTKPTPLTPKADVYSFGILLLEIIGGRRIGNFYMSRAAWQFPALDNSRTGEDEEVGDESSSSGESSAFSELVDPELKGVVDIEQVRAALNVAYWCIQTDVSARPTMATVVRVLEGRVEMAVPPSPSSDVVFSPVRTLLR